MINLKACLKCLKNVLPADVVTNELIHDHDFYNLSDEQKRRRAAGRRLTKGLDEWNDRFRKEVALIIDMQNQYNAYKNARIGGFPHPSDDIR